MPLYEYQCKKCGRVTEKIQKFSDAPLTKCEHCGGKLERLLSAPAIQFKGAGWYVTDYAKKSSASSASGTSEPSASSSEKKEKETSKPKEPTKAAPSKD